MRWLRRRPALPSRDAELAELQAERERAVERLRDLAEGLVPEAEQLRGELRSHRVRNHLGEKAEKALRARRA